jgi:hypothetical protein
MGADPIFLQIAMEEGRIRSCFTLAVDKTVSGKTFPKGTTFKLTTSWKPTLEQVKEAPGEDFAVRRVFSNRDMSIVSVGLK